MGEPLAIAVVSPNSVATGRVRSLDGLRGVAALMVLCSHAMLIAPMFADAVLGTGGPEPFGFGWWWTYTPLHLLWAGTEAVFMFFILSGFVLAGSVSRPGFAWRSYYLQRLPRLYLPVWGSLLFAAALLFLVPRTSNPEASWWTEGHRAVPVGSALVDAALLGPISVLNFPIWSLQWEVWFSLLLPGYILVARLTRNSLVLTLSLLVVIFGLMGMYAFTGSDALRYLPIFALGVLLYTHRGRVTSIAAIADRKPWLFPTAAAFAIVLLSSFWMLQGSGAVPDILVSAARLLQVAGATLAVLLVLCWRRAARIFEGRVVEWLGSRSFSIYLIHDPIVSSTAHLLGGAPSPFVVLAVSLPVSLLVADLFFRVVERPGYKISKKLGRSTRGSH